MKINQIKILFIIYSFFILIPFYKSEQIKIINIESIENSNNQTQQNLSINNSYEDDYKDEYDDDYDDKEREREKERDKDRERDRKEKERERERENPDKRDKYDWGNWEMSEEVKNLSDQVFNLNNEIDNVKDAITMNKLYMVLYSIVAGILFLVIVIYSSIKCFILCTKRNVYDYRLSYITDKLGEFYLDENENENENENDESKINKKEKKSKSKDYDAPISASNSNQKSKYSTFNPDNYISSNEDKKLYKPYKNEDIQ